MTRLNEIKKYARQIADKFRPKKIILFGSYAYGKPHRDSDVDLMVIMPFKGKAVDQEVKIKLAIQRSFPLDLLASTPGQFLKRRRAGDYFFQEIADRGKVLYEAHD